MLSRMLEGVPLPQASREAQEAGYARNEVYRAKLKIADLYKTNVCPLAKVMRRELKKRGIDSLKVVYSKEKPLKPMGDLSEDVHRRQIPGSLSFVPAAAGLILAGEVIRDLTVRV